MPKQDGSPISGGQAAEYSSFELGLFHKILSDIKDAYRVFKGAKIKSNDDALSFSLNPTILSTVCFHYLNELKKYNTFSFGNRFPTHLFGAAHISRLINKLRPISFDSQMVLRETELLYLNEEFAIFIFYLYIGMDKNAMKKRLVKDVAHDLKTIFSTSDPQVEILIVLARLLEGCSGLAEPQSAKDEKPL